MPSTSPMAACAASKPMSSGRSPPTSAESESLPSENAPAPENPVVMRHGSQPTHSPACSFGHFRCSTGNPASTSTMRASGRSFSSPSAVKMPEGPAPTMTTSASVSRFMIRSSPAEAPPGRRQTFSGKSYHYRQRGAQARMALPATGAKAR